MDEKVKKTVDTIRDQLVAELSTLPEAQRAILDTFSFDREKLLTLAASPESGLRRPPGTVALPEAGDVVTLPEPGTPEHVACDARGRDALRNGECALVVLAGGMATRMGGVVKALIDAVPGHTFLEMRLAEQAHLANEYGVTPPLWLMTSHSTEQLIRDALGTRVDGYELATFRQRVSVRLTEDRGIFRDGKSQASLYATGHGDFPDALRDSGLLDEFRRRGGRYVLMANLDNLGGGLDPVLIGFHLLYGESITCEVVDKLDGDRGGIPVRADGRPVVLEEFLLPSSFDPTKVRVFNSNTLAFDAETLAGLRPEWSFFEVKKEVEGRKVVQFERLVHEATFVTPTRFVRVPRSGLRSRFLPVKNESDLESQRAALLALGRERGMLPGSP